MKQLFLFLALASFQFSCKKDVSSADQITAEVSSNAAVRFSFSGSFPFDETIFSDCTNEYVHITGEITFSENQIISGGGPSHYNSQLRYTNVVTTGLTTGNEYIYVGAENTVRNAADNKLAFIIQSKFTFMSPGSGVKEILAATIRVITNPDGQVVVEVEKFDFSCK